MFLHGTGIEPRHHGLYDDKVWQLIQGAFEEANGIMVTTEYVRDHLVRNLIDLPLDKFHIQACGVNVTEFYSTEVLGPKLNQWLLGALEHD